MAKRFGGKLRKQSALPLAAPIMLAVLMSPQARADWKVNPAVDLRETYTDNAFQAAGNSANGQFITELTPSLKIANNGPRLKLNASIIEHLYAYSGDGPTNNGHSQLQLAADASAKLVEDLLFLDATASIGQQAVSAFGPQVNGSNGYSNANRAEVRTYRVSPYLIHHFGNAATGEVRYTRDSVSTGNGGYADSDSNTVALSIASGPLFHTLSWGLQYNRQDLTDSFATKSRVENSLANLQYRLFPALALTANGGYEKYDYQGLGGEIAGKTYALGFVWTPSSRTSIQASAGRHYFGKTYSLAANHRSQRTVWTANYADTVTNSRDQFLLAQVIDTASTLDKLFTASIPDPVARRQAVEAYIRATGLPPTTVNNVNYFSNRYFRQKQFVAAAAYNMPKTTAILSVSATKRTALSTQQFDAGLLGSSLLNLNDDTKQKSASLTVNYRLNSRTAANLALTTTRAESLTTGVTNNQQFVSVAMTRQLQSKLRGAVEVRHNQGNAAITGGSKYRENAISASLSLQL
jgi:uncharacterized protein (PEP-CTERM system associated)